MSDQSYWMGSHHEQGDEKPTIIPSHDSHIQTSYPFLSHHVSVVTEDEIFDFGQFCHVDYDDNTNVSDAKYTVQDNPTITTLTRRQTHADGQSESENHTGVSSANARYPEPTSEVSHPYYAARPHCYPSQSQPMPAMYTSEAAAQPGSRGPSRYESFRCHFTDSKRASQHRKECMRFGRKPYKEPESDETIAEIEHNRIYHIERIYNAMTSSEKARDNDQSPAMKRWVHSAYYESSLVESVAHKVLDCLLQQVKLGYRGWKHTDYVADDRKGEDEDRDVDCAGRLDNIIRALEEEKTICEDVMQSASQIRMFVNAPKAYASRKHQNRLGNRKRGQGIVRETTDDNPKPGKTSKHNPRPRRGTASSTATATATQSTNHTPNFLQHPLSRHATPSKSPSTHANLPHSLQTPTFDTRPNPSTTFNPTFNIPPLHPQQHQQPDQHTHPLPPGSLTEHFLSPPVLSIGARSAPVTPDDALPIHHDHTDPWLLQMPPTTTTSTSHHAHAFHTPIDPVLFDGTAYWNANDAVYGVGDANLFDEHQDAALLGLGCEPGGSNGSAKAEFGEFWGLRGAGRRQRVSRGAGGGGGPPGAQ